MKKIISIISIVAILLSFCACGAEKSNSDDSKKQTVKTTTNSQGINNTVNNTNKTQKVLTEEELKTALASEGFSFQDGKMGSSWNTYWSEDEYKSCITADRDSEIFVIYATFESNDKAIEERNKLWESTKNYKIEEFSKTYKTYLEEYPTLSLEIPEEKGKNYEIYKLFIQPKKSPCDVLIRIDNSLLVINGRVSYEDTMNVLSKLGF